MGNHGGKDAGGATQVVPPVFFCSKKYLPKNKFALTIVIRLGKMLGNFSFLNFLN